MRSRVTLAEFITFLGFAMRIYLSIVFILLLISCDKKAPQGFDLPFACNNKCEVAGTMNELKDAVANSAAGFSNCICLESGDISGDIMIGKSLNVVGKNDGTTHFSGVESGIFIGADDTIIKDISIVSGTQGITVSKAQSVILENIKIAGITTENSVLRIESSTVVLQDSEIKNISAGSLYGGRGIVVTGKNSNVEIKSSIIDNIDATGLIISGPNIVSISQTVFSNCGFAGIWTQNLIEEEKESELKIVDCELIDNAAVSLEILGKSKVTIDSTTIHGIDKREVMIEVVGDGIVMKSSFLNENPAAFSLNNVKISGFERAGVILDGENGKEIKVTQIKDLKISDESGRYGLIIQNAIEPQGLRAGVLENPFSENDKTLTEPLYLLESIEMQ